MDRYCEVTGVWNSCKVCSKLLPQWLMTSALLDVDDFPLQARQESVTALLPVQRDKVITEQGLLRACRLI